MSEVSEMFLLLLIELLNSETLLLLTDVAFCGVCVASVPCSYVSADASATGRISFPLPAP